MRSLDRRTAAGDRRFAAAVDCAQLGVWDADLVAGTCYYSPSWKRMIGYEDHELRDHPDLWLAFVHPEDRQSALESGDRHLAGLSSAVECEFRIRHRHGHWVWVLDRGKVIERDAKGQPTRMVGVQTDITAQKDAATCLELLNRRIELTLDASGIGLWSFEPECGRILWDARMREIYGIGPGPAEVPKEAWHDSLHPDDATMAETAAAELVETGTPVRMTYRIVRPDGAVRHVLGLSRTVETAHQPRLVVGSIWDVTEQVNRSEALASEKERLRVILRSIGDAVLATDAEGAITFANLAAERLLLLEQAELLGRQIHEVLPLQDERTGAPIDTVGPSTDVTNGIPFRRDEPAVFIRRDGEQRSLYDTTSSLFNASGKLVGNVVVVQDATKERARQLELAHLARHDGLTDLQNRAAFDAALAHIVEDPGSRCAQALFYLDLDRFKVVNDTAGHAAGDALLRLVAQAMTATLPETALIARLGGDEFAVLMEVAGVDDAQRTGRQLVKAIGAQKLVSAGHTYTVGVSIGAVLLKDVPAEPLTALSLADAACYTSKSGGRNKVSVYDKNARQDGAVFAEVRAASDLLTALDEDRLVLYGQQIRDLSSPKRSSQRIEVLSRLIRHDGTLIMPGEFIPAAERFDLMGVLDRRVIRQSLEMLAAAGGSNEQPHLSINLSAMSLSDPELWSFVASQLKDTGVSPHQLCFEITETATMNNFSNAERFVHEARHAGCLISLDDFGEGLSSFAYLRRFPVDVIKIDGTFVQDVADSGIDQAICAAIGTIAAELGIEVVAERVTDMAAVGLLRARGIGFGQSFFLHRPEPLASLLGTSLLRSLDI